MKKINSWYIEEGHTATFGNDDFESWWLAGMDRDDKIKKHHRIELYENCLYLAEAEQREMTQSASELKSAINDWADDWNKKIDVSAAAAALGSIKSDKKAASSRENGKKGGRPKTEVFEMNWETNGFKAWKTKKGVVVEIWNRNQGMHTGRKALLAGKTTLPTENDWQTYLYAAKYPESSITLKKGHKVQ